MDLSLHLPVIDAIWSIFLLIYLAGLSIIRHFQFQQVAALILVAICIYLICWKLLPPIVIVSRGYIAGRLITIFIYKIIGLLLLIAIIFPFEEVFSINFNKPAPPTPPINIFYLILSSIPLFTYFINLMGATWASSTGYLNYWIPWAFIPCYPILWIPLYFLFNPSHRKEIYKLGLYSLCMIIVFFSSIFFAPTIGPLVDPFISKYLVDIIVIYVIIFGLGLIFINTRIAIRYLHDWRQWRTGSIEHKKLMTYREFWKTLNVYRTNYYRVKMIRAVRELDLLVITEEAEDFFRKIVWEAKKRLTLKESQKSVRKKDKRFKIRKTLMWIDYATLDEIYGLLEDIRSTNEDVHLHRSA